VRHATPGGLDRLEPLLGEIRELGDGLVERKRGTFYRRGRAFLHFHEDPAGDFADLRTGAEFERIRVTTERERRSFLRRIRGLLAEPA